MGEEFVRLFGYIVLFAGRAGSQGLREASYTRRFAEWSERAPLLVMNRGTEEAMLATWNDAYAIAPGPSTALLEEMRAFRGSTEAEPLTAADFQLADSPRRTFFLGSAKTIIDSLKELPGIHPAAKAAAEIIKELLEFLKTHYDSLRR